MSKEKFDLSNVGGQPKDWMQKNHEAEVASNWREPWLAIGLVVLPLLILGGIGYFLFSLLKYAGKFN